MKNVTVFVDESGIISKHQDKKTNCFIITLLFIEDQNIDYVKKHFRKYRLQIAKKKTELMNELRSNKEIKGSSMTESDKHYIYNKLFTKCAGRFELGIILLNNDGATEKFRSNSSRAFNFLIKLYLQYIFKKSSLFENLDNISFIIDERNVAPESKFTLQEYLNTELNLLDHFCNGEIHVSYKDSKNYILLQMADFISNTCYRKWQKKNEDNGNTDMILKQTLKGKPFVFPLKNEK